MEITFINL